MALLTATCLTEGGFTGPATVDNRVLFVGNSLTSANDLPGMVQQLGRSAGMKLNVGRLLLDNHALIDFIVEGAVEPAIAKGGWNFIVMQQGPTTVPICRDTLVIAAREIDRLGRQAGAKSVVMMAWPNSSRQFDFDKVHESAQMAAVTIGGQFAPVGDAWRSVLAQDPSLPLYGPDGYHPAAIGTYLAALVIFEQVTGKDARTLPTTGRIPSALGLSRETVTVLQSAAHSANADAFARPVAPWTPSAPPSPPITC